jgi:predicted pyridoxine 5'-phosphate oxidase superfamily flavin-nucleotide-binding protein
MSGGGEATIPLGALATCFEGVIPAVIATAAADGTPNVTHLSKVHLVDDEHVALSNQFFSKTVRNLAENPRASVLVVDPHTFDCYKLTLTYERTERSGPLFDRLHRDVEAVAALTGMTGVFRLRSADIYRVVDVRRFPTAASANR